MRMTHRERDYMREVGRTLIYGFGCTNTKVWAEDGKLSLHAEYRGKYVDYCIPRIDFHYPTAPKKGACDLAHTLFYYLTQKGEI